MSAEDEFFKQRGFGLTMGFGLRPAVLVVDLIEAFTDPEAMLGSNLDAQVLATQQLLAAARQVAVPIIYSTVSYEQADLADAGIWALKQKGVIMLLWHRSDFSAGFSRCRYLDPGRMHHQRVRTCNGG